MRIDKLLWFLRLARSRSFARTWAEAGHMRINGRRVEKPSCEVRAGDVLTLPMRSQVRVVEVMALPVRRGPPAEAQACYRVLDGSGSNPIAATDHTPEGTVLP
ncbi:RNA-binding S4 domain-containing protein [Parablastomonas sp. CN1-191]|uniref:RNA-binding S4 domain-containing protein n=1 Tax=Parablastomonas sp. CN1-191 TaxID=3400908 RepID=UPI003BF872DF